MNGNPQRHSYIPTKHEHELGSREDASDAGIDAFGSLPDVPERDHHSPASGRVLFTNTVYRKSSIIGRWRDALEEAIPVPSSPAERSKIIPSPLQQRGEEYVTPLPVLSMLVLSITMLGEFLSANVSAPWILFMVKGFHRFSDEAENGYWTGILVSTFFLTQFMTSLLWATVAAKYGQRVVLGIALFGTAITCLLFGISTSLRQAMAIRLMQGVFGGAVGVARGCVTVITDQSNEGRAYAILGFCWGLGGVAGAVVGGAFESPALKWPSVFGKIPLFVVYPYLLPCTVAASVTLAGSVMCLFLGPDGGPREGPNLLSLEKGATIGEREVTATISLFDGPERHAYYGSLHGSFKGSLRDRPSSCFARHTLDERAAASHLTHDEPASLLSTPYRISRSQALPQTNGLVYDWHDTYRSRAGSTTTRRRSRAVSHRRNDNADDLQAPVGAGSFTQKLVLANKNSVNGLSDLWVAAAMTGDGDDVSDVETETDLDADEDQDQFENDANTIGKSEPAATAATPAVRSNRFYRTRSLPVRYPSRQAFGGGYSKVGSPGRRSSGSRFHTVRPQSSTLSLLPPIDVPASPQHIAAAKLLVHGAHTQSAVTEQQPMLAHVGDTAAPLPPILESQRAQDESVEDVRERSLLSQLPVLVIIQYGLLALHTTTHDQVFYLYLVSKYPSGGLNLDAGAFSQLIALMCLAQIAYQFYLYPYIGPPRGPFSHTAMFRIGSLLFIPSYLSVVLYRPLASPTGNGSSMLMSALALSTAVRYCGATFTFTSVAVLLNYMSPPHMVGYANGVAQSIVSLARFLGPILGGTLWSMSVQGGPSGYALGFIACAGVCVFAVMHSLLIR